MKADVLQINLPRKKTDVFKMTADIMEVKAHKTNMNVAMCRMMAAISNMELKNIGVKSQRLQSPMK